MNIDLKVAIVRSRKTQRAIAQDAGIPEVRLSKIVQGVDTPPTFEEREALAIALQKSQRALGFREATV